MDTLKKILLIIIVLIHIIISPQALAQDGHYWTQQYGTRSMLLSGSVIGGVEDLGAVFYNPGRLGLIENPAFLLSADVYQWTRFTMTDTFGETADINKSEFGGVPTLAAGTFKLGFLEGHSFAYAILLRQSLDLDIDYKEEKFGDIIQNFPGEEYFGGSIRIAQHTKEEWASLTWSYPFSEKISLGISTNIMVYDQNKGNVIELQALTSTNETAIYRYNRNFGFNNYGILWKAGFATNFNKLLLGLTVTTPVIGLIGSGRYEFEEFFSGISGMSEREDEYTTNAQDDLAVEYRKPWSVGLGVTIPVKRSKIHMSSEWYSAIPGYTLMEVSPYVSQSSGDTLGFRLVDELQSVINFGIGAEIYLNEKASFFSSFCSDYSAVSENRIGFSENKPVAANTVFSADYFHYGGGFILQLKGVDLTLGATYTGGEQDVARPVDFPDEEDDGIFDQDETATLRWDRWRLVFSFSVRFLKEYTDKVID